LSRQTNVVEFNNTSSGFLSTHEERHKTPPIDYFDCSQNRFFASLKRRQHNDDLAAGRCRQAIDEQVITSQSLLLFSISTIQTVELFLPVGISLLINSGLDREMSGSIRICAFQLKVTG